MTAVAVVCPCRRHHGGAPPGAGRPELRSRPGRRRARAGSVHARRRAVALVAVLAACLALRWAVGGLGGAPLAASEPTSPEAGRRAGVVHVVKPGDTLWQLARAFQPDGDVRPLVDRLAAERAGRPLLVGERIRAP